MNGFFRIVDRLGPRVLEPLYSGDLGINIRSTRTDNSVIRLAFDVLL